MCKHDKEHWLPNANLIAPDEFHPCFDALESAHERSCESLLFDGLDPSHPVQVCTYCRAVWSDPAGQHAAWAEAVIEHTTTGRGQARLVDSLLDYLVALNPLPRSVPTRSYPQEVR